MEISITDYKELNKIQEVKIRETFRHETVDITVECPKCKLEYIERYNEDDDWHLIECDKCGTKYKYRYLWL